MERSIGQLLHAGKERGYVLFEEIEALLPDGYESGAEEVAVFASRGGAHGSGGGPSAFARFAGNFSQLFKS